MLDLSALQLVEDAEVLADVKQTIHKLWGLSLQTCNVHQYTPPCTNPCSIMRADLHRIRKGNYRAGMKTDGVRFFMLFSFYMPLASDDDDNYVMLMNRAGHTYRVPFTSQVTRDTEAIFAGTLLDGELYVSDGEPGEEAEGGKLTYIVFDTIATKGYDKRRLDHPSRIAAAEEIVAQVGFGDVVDVKVKVWYSLPRAITLYHEAKQCGGAVDGLILVPVDSPLGMHTQRDLFKWKPAEAHTLDLLFNGAHLMTMMSGTMVPLFALSDCMVEDDDAVERNVVTEFAFARDGNKWRARAVKIRTDKFLPNDMRVCRLTLQNIDEAIGLEELARFD